MYGGLALSQNTQTYPGVIPVRPVNQPREHGVLPSHRRRRSPRSATSRPNGVPVAANSFLATVDLSGVQGQRRVVTVRIEVKPLDSRGPGPRL